MSSAERVARLCLWLAFWLPLAGCTYLALTPVPPEAVFRISDVVLHALAFGYLTFALGLCRPRAPGWLLAAVMLTYGLGIEALQSFQPERSAEIKDLLVDLGGIGLGLGLRFCLGERVLQAVRGVVRLLSNGI